MATQYNVTYGLGGLDRESPTHNIVEVEEIETDDTTGEVTSTTSIEPSAFVAQFPQD